MSLETATFIDQLDINNPVTTDTKSQGDDHLRLLKNVLKNSIKRVTRAFYVPGAVAKSANYTVLASDDQMTIYCNTTAGAFTLTLPALTTTDAGWFIEVIKVTFDVNPVFIVPASGSIQTGEVPLQAKLRRCIPGFTTKIHWSGSSWTANRVVGVPLGSIVDCPNSALPAGYEWANGQTLASAAANYPEYLAVRGSAVVPDRRGRVAAGRDDMGGTSANRLTGQPGGLNGDTLEATGGLETHTLTLPESPAHDHGGATNNTTPSPTTFVSTNVQSGSGKHALSPDNNDNGSTTAGQTVPQHQHAIVSAGGGGAHNNVQPTIISNMVVVVE